MEIAVKLLNRQKRFGHLDWMILGSTLIPVALFFDPSGHFSAGMKLLVVAPGFFCLAAALLVSIRAKGTPPE